MSTVKDYFGKYCCHLAFLIYNEYMMLYMNSFWSRVESLYNEDLNQSWLSQETGIKQSTISGWKQKDRMPPADRAVLIARALGVSVEYLVFGEDAEDAIDSVVPAPISLEGYFVTPSLKTYKLHTGQDVVNIPIWDQKVSAGHGETLIEQYTPEKVLPLLNRFVSHYDKDKLHVVEVKGDSMTEVHIDGGDLVVFAEKLVEGDGLYVISYDGEAFVKRLEFDRFNNQVVVHSENKRYQPKAIPADSEMLQIEGKVVGWYHNHPG